MNRSRKTIAPIIPEELHSALSQAKALVSIGQFQTAFNLLEPWIAQRYLNPGLYVLAARCMEQMGKIRNAKYIISTGSLLFPRNQEIRSYAEGILNRVNGVFINANFNQTSWPSNVPSISLVLIVKNEEKDLARCLTSFQDIVQEMIVVDTGSTDHTVEIARSFGARVEFFPWQDDFAAARNESLKYATCDWILRTDADEYIEDQEKPKLLHAITSGIAEVYLGLTHSKMADGSDDIVNNVRLITNHLGVRYDNPMHETITPSAVKLGLKQANTNIHFIHTGYHVEKDGYEKKVKRNLQACESGLKKDPGNYYLKLIRATTIYEQNQGSGITELEEAIRGLPEETLSIKYLGVAYIYLAVTYSERKDMENLSRILRLMVTDFIADNRMMQFAGQVCLYNFEDIKEAAQFFLYAYNLDDLDLLENILPSEKYNRRRVGELIIESSVLLGNYSQARQYLRLSADRNGQYRKPTKEDLARAVDEFSEGRYGNGIDILEKYPLLSADDHRLLAKAYQKTGQWQKAVNSILFAAAETEIVLKDYMDLVLCQIQLNRLTYARDLIIRSRELSPDNPVSYNLESIIAVREKNIEEAVELSVRSFIGDSANAGYQENLEKLAGMNNMTPIQALKATGLNWMDRGDIKNGLFTLMAYSRFQPDDPEIRQILDQAMKV
jgi:glycosyltransferase involved in cell wall biosynthesis